MEAAGLISNGGEEDTTLDFNITFEDNAIEDFEKLMKEGFALDSIGPVNFSYELGEMAPSAERNQPVLNEQANDPCMNLALSPDFAEEFLKLLGEDGSNHEQESTQPSAREIQRNDVSFVDLPDSSQFVNFGGASSSTIQSNPSVGAIQPYLPNKQENRQSIATEMQGNGETQQNWMNLNPTLPENQNIISGITGDSVLSTVSSSQFMNFGQSSSTSPSMGATQPCSLSGEQGDLGFSAGGNQSQLVKQTTSAQRPGQSVYSTLPESLQGNSANVGQPGQSFFGPVSTHQTLYPSMKNGVVQLEHEANWMKQQNQINDHLQNAYQIEFNLPQLMAPTTQVAVGSSTEYADQFMQNIASNNMMGGTSSSNIYGQAPLYSSSYSQTPSMEIVDGTTSSYGINVLQQQQQLPSWAMLTQNVPYAPWTPAPSRSSMHNQYVGGNNVFELQTGSSMFPAGAGRSSMHFRPQTLTNQLQLHNKVPFPEFTNPYDSQYHNYSIPHSGVGHYVHPRPTFNQFTYAPNNAYDYDPRSYNSMLTEPSLSTRIPRQFSSHHQQQVLPRKDIFRPYNSVLPGQAAASSSSSRRQNSTGVQTLPEILQNFYSKKKFSFTRVLAGKFMANQASDAPNLSKAQLENYRPPSLGMRSKGLEELLHRPVIRSAANPILDTLEKTLNCTSDSEQPETGERYKEASGQAASEQSESSNEQSKESKKKKKVLECHGRSKKIRFECVDSPSVSSAKFFKNHDTPQKKLRTGERDHQPTGASTILEQFMNKNSGNNQVTTASGARQFTMSNPLSTENLVYNPLFESHGLPADPHLRLFASK